MDLQRDAMRLATIATVFVWVGWIAVLTWSGAQILMVAGAVAFDYNAGATGAFAIETVALVYIGAWIAGANLLAGPWLGRLRWLGAATGAGIVVFSIGLLLGGMDHPLTYVGGIGYSLLLPAWAWFMARLFANLAAPGQSDV